MHYQSEVHTTPPSFNGLGRALANHPLIFAGSGLTSYTSPAFRDWPQMTGMGQVPEQKFESLANAVTLTAVVGTLVAGVVVGGIYSLIRRS